MADFHHLPTHAKFIALMPQWDFLNFLASEAAQVSCIHPAHGVGGHRLIQQPDGIVTGVRADTQTARSRFPPSSPLDAMAATPSRASPGISPSSTTESLSTSSGYASLASPTTPKTASATSTTAALIVLINRVDYFQVGYIIAKDTFPQIQQQGLPAFQQSIERIVPFLTGRTAEIDSWEKVSSSPSRSIASSSWCSPGLLCIGDAAHAMSPVGGIGINIALQDAVATANMLTESLSSGSVTVHDLERVQHYRENAVRNTQRFQVFAHRLLNHILQNPGPFTPPLAFRIIAGSPGFRYLTARFIGMGLQPQHIDKT